ncbi:MAG: amidohydrolase [Acidobacteria bacterium]|nr:amidohydrolase [Acidobacteriota bacterium]MCZ6751782.1 amidohydrolase family protein [Acidobacteriota bacterium]
MTNRRNFLKTVAYATAGTFVMGRSVDAAAQAARREISVGGRRVKVVDIHAHCGFREVDDLIRGTNLAGHNVSANRILGPERLQWMDERGIDVQALSVNQYWWYAADEDLARRLIRVQDEGLAAWCDARPDRFVGLTSVALQHPDLAAEQLEHAVKNLGLRGASIGGHVAGEVPSSSRFDPFWAKAEELGVPIFMHPDGAKNVIREGGLDARVNLGNIIGNPLETTVFFSHLIFDGTLDRFPGLRICGAHGGGFLPSYLGRTEVTCRRGGAECINKKRPSEYLKTQLLADSMVFSAEGLRHLVAEMGASQVVYGSDLPFMWPDTLDLILDATFLSNAEKEAILGGNLMRLLRIA